MAIFEPGHDTVMTTATDVTDAEHVHRRLPAVPASVGHARGLIVALADSMQPAPRTREGIALAISEAVSNVVLHAYDEPDGDLDLFAIRVRDELIVSISDRGRGRAAVTSTPGLGYGMTLIRDSADDVSIRDGSTGGTVVQLRFALAAGQPAIAAA